jgi:hypothetical protein
VHFWQYTVIQKKQNYTFLANTWSETKRFPSKHGVNLCVFGDNTVFEKIRLCRGIFILLSRNWSLPHLLLDDLKYSEKRTIKCCAFVPLTPKSFEFVKLFWRRQNAISFWLTNPRICTELFRKGAGSHVWRATCQKGFVKSRNHVMSIFYSFWYNIHLSYIFIFLVHDDRITCYPGKEWTNFLFTL